MSNEPIGGEASRLVCGHEEVDPWARIAELNRHAEREAAAANRLRNYPPGEAVPTMLQRQPSPDARRLIRGPELRRAHDAQASAQTRRDLAARVLDDKVSEVSKAALDLTEAEEALEAAKAASAKLERERPAVLGVVP